MNTQIRELVKQAGGIGHDDDGDELTPALVGKSLEQFAELIVRECAQIADKAWAAPGYQIKQHFGVQQ
jgi:hypothetical protein